MQAVPIWAACFHLEYDAQNRPAIVEWNNGPTAAKYAYIHNLQGDIVGIVDSSGTEVVKYTYDAWGKVLSTTGSLASTLGTIQPFRYRGYVYDVETGLYYLRSRYYNTNWNRFLNADSLIMANLYCYCENKPIKNFDPDGFHEWDQDGSGGGIFYLSWNFNTIFPHGPSTTEYYFDSPQIMPSAPDISTSYYVEKYASIYEESWINSIYNNAFDYTYVQIQICANIANKNVSGKGPVTGTKIHTIFGDYVRGLNNPNLRVETSYLGGNEVRYAENGSIRFDVMEVIRKGDALIPIRAWDLKTGNAILTPGRIEQMQQESWLEDLPITMIKPYE